MKTTLGFATGLMRHLPTQDAIEFIQKTGCEAVEVNFPKDYNERDWISEIPTSALDSFKRVSVHLPKIPAEGEYGQYADNDGTEVVFGMYKRLKTLRNIDAVIVHPNMVSDFDVLPRFGQKVLLENLDKRNTRYTRPEDFRELFSDSSPFGMILDLNHVFTHDPSMRRAKEFYDAYGDRVGEIHLSGFTELHEPLFRTKQDEIIYSIQDFSTPIILEGTMKPEELSLEMEYVLNKMEDYINRARVNRIA